MLKELVKRAFRGVQESPGEIKLKGGNGLGESEISEPEERC